MRKILDGKRFDTSTATLIGEADNIGRGASSQTDFQWWTAGLYRSPRKAYYFLAGKGGPMSRFAQATGQNTWSGGSDIIQISEEEARQWAEANLSAEQVESFFEIEEA